MVFLCIQMTIYKNVIVRCPQLMNAHAIVGHFTMFMSVNRSPTSGLQLRQVVTNFCTFERNTCVKFLGSLFQLMKPTTLHVPFVSVHLSNKT